MAKSLIFVAALSLALQQITAQETCGENSIANSCWSPCETTCRTRFRSDDIVCLAVCQDGCTCIDGYLKNDDGVCVPINECSAPLCNDDEEYLECGSACETTCDSLNNTCINCIALCVEGCFCKEGYVRNANTETCSTVDDCVASRVCTGENEVWDDCSANCPPQVCNSLWLQYSCTTESNSCCEPQCRCAEGFYRDGNNVCVSSETCLANRDDEIRTFPQRDRFMRRRN